MSNCKVMTQGGTEKWQNVSRAQAAANKVWGQNNNDHKSEEALAPLSCMEDTYKACEGNMSISSFHKIKSKNTPFNSELRVMHERVFCVSGLVKNLTLHMNISCC